MSVDLDKLEQLARAATPGPWEARGGTHQVVAGQGEGRDGVVATAREYSDVDFIAAANPAAVLELVQRLRAAERRNEGLAAKAREAIGDRTIEAFIERAQVLDAIVRDLATSRLAMYASSPCPLCGHESHPTSSFVDDNHTADCLVARAVEATKP